VTAETTIGWQKKIQRPQPEEQRKDMKFLETPD
jgi:hypothetical protein